MISVYPMYRLLIFTTKAQTKDGPPQQSLAVFIQTQSPTTEASDLL